MTRRDLLVRAASAVAAVAYAAPMFLYPLFEDTALFLAIGELIGDGEVLYRDVVDQKPPGIFAVTAATAATLGESSIASRFVELAAVVAMAVACARLVRLAVAEEARWLAAPVTIALSSSLLWGLAERGQVEWFQASATAWGALLVARCLVAPAARWPAFGAGAFLGLSCWFKPQGAIAAVLLGLLAIARALADRRGRVAALRAGLLLAGAAAASAPFLAWLLLSGGMDGFLFVMFDFNVRYAGESSPSFWQALGRLQAVFWPWGPAWTRAVFGAVCALGLGALFRHREVRWLGGLVAAWIVAGVVQFYAGRYLFRYHAIPLVPALAVCATAGGWTSVRFLASALRPKLQPALAGALAAALALSLGLVLGVNEKLVGEWRDTAAWLAGLRTKREIYAAYGDEMHYYSFLEQRELARWIRERTDPEDRVHVLGRAGAFYLHVDRRPGARYLVTSAALSRSRDPDGRMVAELVDDLERTRPAYLLVRENDGMPWFGNPPSARQVTRWPELMALLREDYRVEDRFGRTAAILRRRDHEAPAP